MKEEYTYEKMKEIASNFRCKTEFRRKHKKLYFICKNNGWLNEELVSQFKNVVSKPRIIYCYTFDDNSVYVGLTCEPKRRKNSHMTDTIDSVVARKIHFEKLNFKYEELTDFIDENDAKIKEGEYVEYYRSLGFTILNKLKTGGIGNPNNKLWNYQKCKEEASKYTSKSELRKANQSCLIAIQRNNWYDELCSHFIEPLTWNDYTKEQCHEIALQFDSRTKFCKKYKSLYFICTKKGWISDICDHMELFKKPNSTWNNKNNCLVEALKYNTRTEFNKNSNGAYEASLRNNWLDEICVHMTSVTDKTNIFKIETTEDFKKYILVHSVYYHGNNKNWNLDNLYFLNNVLENIPPDILFTKTKLDNLLKNIITKLNGKRVSLLSKDYYITIGWDEEYATIMLPNQKERSVVCTEYWMKKGHTLEESMEIIKKYQSEVSKNKIFRREYSPLCTEYWIKKGHTLEESMSLISERQKRINKRN